MKNISVAMLGARMHYAIPRLLFELGSLDTFYTDSYIGNKPWLEKIINFIPTSRYSKSLKKYLNRNDPVIPPEKVKSFERFGLWYALARSKAKNFESKEHTHVKAAQIFNRLILSNVTSTTNAVWGFNGASLELFQSSKQRQITCILEQTILPKQLEIRHINQEFKRWPDWELGLEVRTSPSLLENREMEEWELADIILAGSDYVRTGLLECGVPNWKIKVIFYGVDVDRFRQCPKVINGNKNQQLKILFAGQVGLRKGLPDLLQAVSSFNYGEVELKIAGDVVLNKDKLTSYSADRFQFLGRVPRSEMPKLYQWADIFVLPSIVEGSATVIYEALMSGLPVITTPNSGSIVRNGSDGFIVPARNPDALAKAISIYLKSRSILESHKDATIESRKMASINRYRSDLVEFISSFN